MNGYRDPFDSSGCFYPVSISPAMFIILNIVIEDKNIRFDQLLEESSPWDIGWLKYCDNHAYLQSFLDDVRGAVHASCENLT